MIIRQPRWRLSAAVLSACGAAALIVGTIFGSGGTAQAAAPDGPPPAAGGLPCNIYGASGTPCVGAYSTVRALYTAYKGPLYQVTRTSDNTARNIGPLRPGGVADASAQDAFCAGTSCTITQIYDQSPRHNDLTIEGPGPYSGFRGVPDVGAPAAALPVYIQGHKAYGLKISTFTGYRDDETTGVAVNGQPEGMYMVTSGSYVNDKCCFDFGNAETNNADNGNGHMDAVTYSTRCARFSPCYGEGPWVQADLENGLFQSDMGYSENPSNTGLTAPFVTALLENNGQNYFALKGGNAQSGCLATNYAGPLPTIQGGGYSPMQQEGAIVLGTGGDNSNQGVGYFFEGVMTAGVPSNAADNAVQANIVSAGYGRSGPGYSHPAPQSHCAS